MLRECGRSRWVAPIRALLSLGIVLGFFSLSTMARSSATSAADPGALRAAELDLLANGQLATQANVDSDLIINEWTVSDLLPGEYVAVAFTATNGGSSQMPLDFRLDAYVEGVLGPALRFRFHTGGTPTNSSPMTGVGWNTYRQASCGDGVLFGPVWQSIGVGEQNATPIVTDKQLLQVGESRSYCVMMAINNGPVTWDDTAFLNATTKVVFVLRGTQVGAP